MRQRDYKMDNFRFLLIFCVLLGHFIELFPGDFASALYKIIYSFHMPAFLFLTGFFARFDRRKIVLNLIYPYILFQILYQFFDTIVIKGEEGISIKFGTPYWLLWYLLVTIFCYLLLPLFDGIQPTSGIVMALISLALAILAGLDTSLGYYASLARFFSFLPFFIIGHYTAHLWKKQGHQKKPQHSVWLIAVLGLFLIFACVYIIKNPEITRKVLYASYSYEKADYEPVVKLFLIVVSFAWIAFLLLVMPSKKIPYISVLGQHTLSVFLLHGFFVKLAKKNEIFCYSEVQNLLLAFALSIVLLCLLGNPWTAKWFGRLFTGEWINRLWKRRSL